MRNAFLAAALAAAPLLAAQPAAAVTLTVDGAWDQANEFIAPGSFFPTTWDFVCLTSCSLQVSDWAVISDLFEVFDAAISIGLTSIVPSWDAIGCPNSFDASCYTTNPDDAWADSRYSQGSFLLGAGAHLITVQNLFIPDQDDGQTFPDSTVQLRVVSQSPSPVPLPASLGLLLAGGAALGLLKRRRQA